MPFSDSSARNKLVTPMVPVMEKLRYYQRRYAGAMPSGCGVGYIYVASSEPVEGGFQVKVNLG